MLTWLTIIKQQQSQPRVDFFFFGVPENDCTSKKKKKKLSRSSFSPFCPTPLCEFLPFSVEKFSTFHQNETSLHQTTFRKIMARHFHVFDAFSFLFFFGEIHFYLWFFYNKKVLDFKKTVLFVAFTSFASVNCANFAVERVA